MSDIEPAKRDLAYLMHEAKKIGMAPSDADIERFIEHVGKLANDGVDEDEARERAFVAVYELG